MIQYKIKRFSSKFRSESIEYNMVNNNGNKIEKERKIKSYKNSEKPEIKETIEKTNINGDKSISGHLDGKDEKGKFIIPLSGPYKGMKIYFIK